MSLADRVYCAVLAGGSGTRLWPLSRSRRPKQLLRLIGERSLIQQTVDRILPLCPPERILILTEASHADDVREQLPAIPPTNFLVEPARRGTAPALALAALEIARRDPSAVMASLHSDHYIGDEEEFRATLAAAFAAADRGPYLCTLGIRPTRPETGLGYVELGAEAFSLAGRAVLHVRSFVEKPPLALAEQYVASGRFLWNSGIFIWQVATLLRRFQELQPATYELLTSHIVPALGTAGAAEALARWYPRLAAEAIDTAIMEKAPDVLTLPASFGWSDIGSWAELWEALPRDEHGNAARGAYLGLDSRGTLVYAAGGKPIITLGLDDVVVVDTPDVLLVCRRGLAQQLKRLIERLEQDPELRRLL